ncbi:MAG TPA: hypothetical protein VFQ85_10460 [Mycobacteriales bacterium]|nr:hypothetical protein [Mycobacteriales bacterium]
MKRLLLVAALLSASVLSSHAASACSLETCPGTSVVCTRVECRVCYVQPQGGTRCIE